MKRRIEKELLEWKNSPRRKPLIVKGARQVGKTWSVKKLGSDHFENLVNLDMEKNRNFHSLFEGNLDPGSIIQSIEVLVQYENQSRKNITVHR